MIAFSAARWLFGKVDAAEEPAIPHEAAKDDDRLSNKSTVGNKGQAKPTKQGRAPLAPVTNTTAVSAGEYKQSETNAMYSPIGLAPFPCATPLPDHRTKLRNVTAMVSPALSTVSKEEEASWRMSLESLQAGEVIHAATSAAVAAAARKYGKDVTAENMKALQAEVGHIARLSVASLTGAALELDRIHRRQTMRLRARGKVSVRGKHYSNEALQVNVEEADISLRLLAQELQGVECMCISYDTRAMLNDAPENQASPAQKSEVCPADAVKDIDSTSIDDVAQLCCDTPGSIPYFTISATTSSASASQQTEGSGPVLAQLMVPGAEGCDAYALTQVECTMPVLESGFGMDSNDAALGTSVSLAHDHETLEAWLAQRKQELQAECTVATCIAVEKKLGSRVTMSPRRSLPREILLEVAHHAEVRMLRQTISELNVQLAEEKRSKRKMLFSSVVCPHCENIF